MHCYEAFISSEVDADLGERSQDGPLIIRLLKKNRDSAMAQEMARSLLVAKGEILINCIRSVNFF